MLFINTIFLILFLVLLFQVSYWKFIIPSGMTDFINLNFEIAKSIKTIVQLTKSNYQLKIDFEK